MMVAMAAKFHILEPDLSFILGTMEVVMQFKSVVSRAQARFLYSYVRQLCFAGLWMIIVPPLGPDN